jgi:hypothetical protein
MWSTLAKPAPCGAGLTALSEAPSVQYNFWPDDAGKAIDAYAYAYPSFYSNASTLLQFIQHQDVNGYLLKRCVQIVPQIVNPSLTNMQVRNNLYIFQGNPTLGLRNSSELFRVYLNENPTIANAYIESQVATINGANLALDTGVTQVIQNGGFDNPSLPLSGWSTNAGVTISSTYYRSPPNSADLGANAVLNQTISALFLTPASNVQNLTWWATAGGSSSQSYTVTLYFAAGCSTGSQSFSETALGSSSAPGTFLESAVQGSSISYQSCDVSKISFSTPSSNAEPVYIDDVSFNERLVTPSFSVRSDSFGNVYMMETDVFNGVNVSLTYELEPNLPYLNVTSQVHNGGINPVNVTILNAFDGLDTIGAGYAYLYFPGVGFERPSQTDNSLTKNYLPASGWNNNWFAVDMHTNPDWIGADAIFVILNSQNLPSGSGPFTLGAVTNTLFENNTFTTPGTYLHWLQMQFNGPPNIAPGSTYSYSMKYVFVTSHDWTNMQVYNNFFGGSNITNWNNENFGLNYYTGEVANDLAIYSSVSGGTSSPFFPVAVQEWNYYYRMIQAETNGTYTASLARFINASNVLYKITGNSTYLAGLTYASNWLLTMQYTSCCYTQNTEYWFHYDPNIPKINGVQTFGEIFNSSSTMEVGQVISGSSISLGFFQSPPFAQAQNLSGTFRTVFYMNAGSAGTQATYKTTLDYVSSGGVTTTIASSASQPITLPGGSGSPPFSPFESDITLTNYALPAGAALEVQLSVSTSSGTIYVLIDSTNGPSYVIAPLNYPAVWKGTFDINPPQHIAALASPQQQPYFLDLTAISGKALETAYQVTGNPSYQSAYQLALSAIHYGDTPVSGFKILGLGYSGIPPAPRLYSYANSTYIDTDYSTYKAMLVSEFAQGLNNTLMNIAMSRVWQRTIVNSSFVQVNTGESSSPHIEMNSETQPWGLAAWLQYDLYLQNTLSNRNFLIWASLSASDVITSVSATGSANQSSKTTIVANGTGTDTFYLWTNVAAVRSITDNGISISGTYTDLANYPIVGSSYLFWTQTLGQSSFGAPPDTFVISEGPGAIYTNPFKPGPSACNPLPPTPLAQLEAGCLFPAIVNTFGSVVGIPWFIGITVGLVAGMIYLKTENTWIPLIILIAIAPVIGFLLPSQFSGIVYLIVVVAIAGLLYQGFKSRGS